MDSVNFQQKFWLARENFLAEIEECKKNNYNFFESAQPLKEIHVNKCKLISARENLLHYLPKNGVVAEVGTQTGYFARKIIDTTQPATLHTIDINWSVFEREKFLQEIENGVMQIYEGDSVAILSQFPDEHFDWIYIDADHSYNGVSRDIQCASQKVKPNGILVFNDYTSWSPLEAYPYGVSRAVNEFCLTQGWEFIFLALSTNGYHDVAIKKIGGETLDTQVSVEIDNVSNQVKADLVQLQYDKAKLAYKVNQMQEEIKIVKLQYQQRDSEVKQLQLQLQQLQVELEDCISSNKSCN
jgi:predicted O-methyltransferase YrrM